MIIEWFQNMFTSSTSLFIYCLVVRHGCSRKKNYEWQIGPLIFFEMLLKAQFTKDYYQGCEISGNIQKVENFQKFPEMFYFSRKFPEIFLYVQYVVIWSENSWNIVRNSV